MKPKDSRNEAIPQVKNFPFVIKQRIHFEEIDSTNNWAKTHYLSGALREMTVVTANKQTQGRGRFNRTWISPENVNLHVTFCFSIDQKNFSLIGHIPQILAIVVCQLLEKYTLCPRIKWPNDLMVDSKKIGGILCETIEVGNQRAVICGLGLNLNASQEDLHLCLQPATSIFIQTHTMTSIDFFSSELEITFSKALEQLLENGFSYFLDTFKKYSFFKVDDFIKFSTGKQLIVGHFQAISQEGGLVLKLEDGSLATYHAGECLS